MRLLYVVQRYGPEVAGGAEHHCRQFATRLAARGHQVEVLTTCAVNHVDWANHYREGTEEIDGVVVHRLPVAEPRDHRFFSPLNSRVVWGERPVPLYLQERWMQIQGPNLPGLGPFLVEEAPGYDVVVFFTYLYNTTWSGLPAASGLAPTVLHPTAHDEPSMSVRLYDTMFRHPSAFAFSTEEEEALVRRRFGIRTRSAVIGIGVNLAAEDDADEAGFRTAFGLGERPYLLFLGRVEPGKGSEELMAFFAAYKERNPGPLALVVAGRVVHEVPPHPDVVFTGFVDDRTKHSALAGALALVQPSFFESFSMVLTEAWAQAVPALVQGHCDVLVGQARRSGGGLPYKGFAEFEVAVDMLLDDRGLVRRMGEAGRRYVEGNYEWDHVLGRYERFLASACY
jgi:glycosyltransferase involved in cell wall biosynthesis